MKKDRIANSKQNGLRNIIGFSAGNLRTTILFIILFSLFFFHLSCSIAGDLEQYKPPSEPGVCTVVFNANGGSDVPSQTLKPGDKIEPVSTAKPGHTLDGWYREAAFENKWDFDVDTVSADITLHAKWDENPSGVFTVTFFSNGGTVIDPQAIAWGASIDMPANPVREGYAFDNWYADAEYTMYFNFNVPVTADRIAYAKWNANILSISYSGGGGTGSGPSSPVTAAYGTSITMPSNTYTFPGYSFAGWELSGEGAIAGVYAAGAELAVADVSLAIAYGNAGITLTATWAYMIESIDLLAAYLNSCAVNTAEEPIPVKVNVNLDSDWPALLTVLAETGRFVDLDLSGCTGMEIFDPGTSSAGKNRVVRLVLPDSSTATAAESLWSNSTFRNFASLREVSGTAIKILGDYSFIYLPGLEKINFPAMAFIGERVFFECTGLISVTLPDSVTSIGDEAFSNCFGLISVIIPNSVTSIGRFAFALCNKLTSITIPDSVTSIGEGVFSDCTGLTRVTIPDSVTSIGDYAFGDCTGLTSVTIGNSVTSIGDSAFWGCTGLTSIIIPDSVTIVGDWAFYNCTGLQTIFVDPGNNNYSSLDGVLFNKALTSIITFPGGRESVTIPNSVTSIGSRDFYGCTGLASIDIPNSVTSIGDEAFSGCTGLTSVTIPDSVTSIGDWAFYNCIGLQTIFVDPGNNNYSSLDGVLFNKALTSIISFPGGRDSVTIPNSVTSLGAGAFRGCAGLTSVTIPNSVTSIGDWAFSGCTGLSSVTFNSLITSNNFPSGTFQGDLRTKYLAYGIGTYTTTAPVSNSAVWTKQ